LEYEKYKILKTKYGKCLKSLTRCDVPVNFIPGTQNDRIEFKKSCDKEYNSLCEGNAEMLRKKVIAANNKYISLSGDNMECTGDNHSSVSIPKVTVPDVKNKNNLSTGLPSGKPVEAFGPLQGKGNVLWQKVVEAKERLKNLPKDASKKIKIQYTKEFTEAWRRYDDDLKESVRRNKWPTR